MAQAQQHASGGPGYGSVSLAFPPNLGTGTGTVRGMSGVGVNTSLGSTALSSLSRRQGGEEMVGTVVVKDGAAARVGVGRYGASESMRASADSHGGHLGSGASSPPTSPHARGTTDAPQAPPGASHPLLAQSRLHPLGTSSESTAVLSKVLRPGLADVGRGREQRVLTAIASLDAGLVSLEKMEPGISARLMHTLFVKLAVGSTDEPDLEHARAKASALLGGGSASGDATELPQRQAPHLGALGEFLLGRWQEEAVHERALIASASALLDVPVHREVV
jgi:hypothetical protein